MANYTALSGKLMRRFGRDLTTLCSFIWSKALNENSAIRGAGDDFTPQNPHCLRCEGGSAGFNVPRRFVTVHLYTLPFGKGGRFLNRDGVMSYFLGGWQFDYHTLPGCGGAGDCAGRQPAELSGRGGPVGGESNGGSLLCSIGLYQYGGGAVRHLRTQ